VSSPFPGGAVHQREAAHSNTFVLVVSSVVLCRLPRRLVCEAF